MTTIGQSLAAAREQCEYTLADISERTRIRQAVLHAMERDDFGPCGGDFYARGHIRAVCREVGLDPAPLVAQFNARDAEAPPPVTTAPGPEAEPNRAVPEMAEPVGAPDTPAATAAAPAPREPEQSAVGLRDEEPDQQDEDDAAQQRPPRVRPRFWPLFIAAIIVLAAVIAGVQAWPERGVQWEGSTLGLTDTNTGTSEPTPEPSVAEERHGGPMDAREDQDFARGADDVRVRLHAQDRTWIRVTDADGGDVFTGVLSDGSTKDWSHSEELRMHLGNAGATQVEVNGEQLGNPGPYGEVANLVFDAEGMRSR